MVAASTRGDLAEAPAIHRGLLPSVRAVMTRSRRARSSAKAALQLPGRA